jgi:hypothetical protein
MINHVASLAQTLTLYLFLAATYFGWGKAVTFILRIHGQATDSPIMVIWLGWASTLLVFQLLHILFPLTAFVVMPVFAVGLIFFISQLRNVLRLLSQKSFVLVAASASILLLVASWIASRSMLSPENYDSGLYHFNTIRWINFVPIVPGLGLLYGPLGYNQSFFVYVAALNFYPFLEHGRSLANSFLLLLTIVSFAEFLRPVLKRPSLLAQSHPFQYCSILFALPILGFLALTSNGLASPTPDLASTLLQLIMFVILVQGIAEWMNGENRQDHRASVLTILAATAITTKLSNLAFSAVIVSMCLAFSWLISGGHIRGILSMLVPASVVILVWTVRGYILTGYPLFPSTIGRMSVDWAVPIENVTPVANSIYNWSRRPRTHSSIVPGFWDWFGPWSSQISGNIEGVMYPIVLAAIFCIIAMISRWLFFLRKKDCFQCLDWAILLPVVIGLIFWFFTAPDPRFAHALFWLLSLNSALLLLSSLQPFLKTRSYVVVMCVVFMVLNLHFMLFAVTHRDEIKYVSFSGWHSVKTVPLIEKKTVSGLVIYTPEKGDQCWDSPLPCTPYFNPDIRLRIPGELASGFTVRVPQRNAEHS